MNRTRFSTMCLMLFFIASVITWPASAQQHVEVQFSSRVDSVTRPELIPIMKLYSNYLNSRPDSIYDNPYWNRAEKNQFRDFDFSRQSIFGTGIPFNQFFNLFRPFVLSIEPVRDKYRIRTLFSATDRAEDFGSSQVWCIQLLYAIQENGKWVLENAINTETEDWNRSKKGYMQFVYPPDYKFDELLAAKSIRFCDSIAKALMEPDIKPFDFYITDNIDDMGLLEGFDFYFVGSTNGKARESMILSAKGSEYYPHEFVHKIVGKNENRNPIVEEGLADFLGSKNSDVRYNQFLERLAKDYFDNPEIDFFTTIDGKNPWNHYNSIYPTGAMLCELVYTLKGFDGLKKLIDSDTSSSERLIETVCSITKLKRNKMISLWEKHLRIHYSEKTK